MLGLGDNLGGNYKSTVYDEVDNNAVTLFLNNLMSSMNQVLTSRQLTILSNTLHNTIKNYSISSEEPLYYEKNYEDLNNELLQHFIESKRVIGLSEKSLLQYEECISRVFNFVGKGADSITSEDIQLFFDYQLEEHQNSLVTLDNYRRYLNSFYNYCVKNGLLYKNPLLKIERLKTVRKIKQPFSSTEIIYLRENIRTLRDKAIFELLLSSGMRVGELTSLDYKDLNMNDCTVIVHGKGNKEREVFFNELARVSIQRYLNSRKDTNPALFVSLHKPYNRLGITGCENMLRAIGKRAGVSKVHPHRFRRHFATSLLNKGVHLEQIQQLLGHAEICTTQLYVTSDDDEINYNHKRYVN